MHSLNFNFRPAADSYIMNFIEAAMDLIKSSKKIELRVTVSVRNNYRAKSLSEQELLRINQLLSKVRLGRRSLIDALIILHRRINERDWSGVDAALVPMVEQAENLMLDIVKLKAII